MTSVAVLESGPDGRRRWAFPHHVVGQTAYRVDLFIRAGTVGVAVETKDAFWGEGEPAPFTWRSYDVLRLTPIASWHSVDLYFEPGGAFAGWYVNFQTPLERTAAGFRMCDLELDIWVEPDRSWAWKDREEFERLVGEGRITQAQRAAVERDAVDVIERIGLARAPFDDRSTTWHPGASLAPLVLDDWDP
jgi:Protein of unknown function (DUF402)